MKTETGLSVCRNQYNTPSRQQGAGCKLSRTLSWGLVLFCLLSLQGCLIPTRGLKEDIIIKHPDAPMQIIGFKNSKIHVAIYDKKNDRMIEYGWLPLDRYWEGWWIMKYDRNKKKNKED